ncbi:MAG: glycosyltransferase family 1 protein [Chloroflexi bacterium]|nr:MAG: glycosyltransferase family 1 protein [Chloroflexota bacterium]
MSKGKRPFRILMIAPTSFFSEYGGHIRIYEEARALQELEHEVTIVTYYKGDDIPGFDIRRTAPLPWRTDYEVGSSRHKIAFDVYLSVQSLIEGIHVRPDVIHGHMHEGALIGGVLSRLLQVPLVFDFQGSLTAEMVDHNFLSRDGRFYPIVHRLERFINRRLSHAVLTSSIRAKTILNKEFDVPESRIYPLPDCADTHRFDPSQISDEEKKRLRQQYGIPEDHLVVAYLGLLTDYQGVPHLIETAVRLKQVQEKVHFLVMGYPNVQHYQHMAVSRGVAEMMTFTGKVMYQNAPTYLSIGDIAVAPKMSTTEGSGKLLNYMALAQPVVAYDSPVHREYLDQWGVYAPLGDIACLTEAIRALLHNSERRQFLGNKLRQRAVSHYSWNQAGKRIESVYQDLTA